MEKLNNVNGNVLVQNHNINANDNDNVFDKSKNVERIAHQLVDKLGSEGSFEFYCKVAYKLSEAMIWSNYEKAAKGKNPGGLFNWLCRKDMSRG